MLTDYILPPGLIWLKGKRFTIDCKNSECFNFCRVLLHWQLLFVCAIARQQNFVDEINSSKRLISKIQETKDKVFLFKIYGFSYKAHKQSDIYFWRAESGNIVTSFHLILVRKFLREMLFWNSLKQYNARSKSKINYMLSYLNYQQKS